MRKINAHADAHDDAPADPPPPTATVLAVVWIDETTLWWQFSSNVNDFDGANVAVALAANDGATDYFPNGASSVASDTLAVTYNDAINEGWAWILYGPFPATFANGATHVDGASGVIA